MLHLEGYFSNQASNFAAEGGGIYAKYRFYSKDQVFRHFRMAGFARATVNNGHVHQEEIATNGHNSGYQLGLIATQLLHKTALSATAYYEHAADNLSGNEFPTLYAGNAVNYSLSAGRLILPKAYTGYKQTNFNIMIELTGQHLLNSSEQFVDIAPSLQFIFNSQTRLDIGFKYELYSNMLRTAPNGLLLRVEHLIYDVKIKK